MIVPAPETVPPPLLPGSTGRDHRRVGVEVEFGRLGVRRAAEVLQHRFGGRLLEEDPQAVHLEASEAGPMLVELDVRHSHPFRALNPLGRLPAPLLLGFGYLLAPVVPRELVMGPLERTDLGRVNEAVAALHEAGAAGDGGGRLGAYGLHFNIAQPTADIVEIVSTFKAFLILEPWLRQAVAPTARARTHQPPPYPPAYVQRVLAETYWPELGVFATDYVTANPTRKRALDLLPLLQHFAGEELPPFKGKVRRRPAFHYRLPFAHVGRAGWTIDEDWERWQSVERLAAQIAAGRPQREPS